MQDSPTPIDLVLAHEDWVRELARSLMQDEAQAEDVVQDTLLASLARPVSEIGNLRRWLGGVVRNLVYRRLREQGLRAEVADAAKLDLADGALDPSQVLEREAARTRLVELVLALEERYRNVVLLHYLEGCSQEETAEQLGLPVATVRTQLMRARALLCEKIRKTEVRGKPMWMGLAAWTGPEFEALFASELAKTTAVTATLRILRWGGALAVGSALFVAGLHWADTASTGARGVPDARAASAPLSVVEPAVETVPAIERTDVRQTVAGAAATRPWAVRGNVTLGEVHWKGLARGVELRCSMYAGVDERGKLLATEVAQTDVAGGITWLFERPREGTVTLVIDCEEPDHVLDYARSASWMPGDPVPHFANVVVFPLDRTIAGRVHSGGIPIAGAAVATKHGAVSADAAGRFEIQVSSRRRHNYVYAWADGHGRGDGDVHPDGDAQIDFDLAAAATVAGRVVDEHGEPIEGARIQVGLAPVRWIESATDGTFHDGSYEASKPQWYTVAHPEHAPRRYVLAPGSVSSREPFEIRLERGATLAGIVLGLDGAPLPKAQVELSGNGLAKRATRSDAYGAYRFERVPSSEVRIIVSAPGTAQSLRTEKVMTGAAAWNVSPIQLSEGHALAGSVVDADGVPIAGALVSARTRRLFVPGVRSDAEGRYLLAHLPEGELTVSCSFNEVVQRAKVEPVHWATGLEIQFERRPGELFGSCADAATGLPLEGTTVRIFAAGDAGGAHVWRQGLRFATGEWSTTGTYAPLYEGADATVVVQKEGYVPAFEHTVVLPQSRAEAQNSGAAEGAGLALSLIPATAVAGKVFDEHGSPVGGALVRASYAVPLWSGSEHLVSLGSGTTSASGFFEVRGVGAGRIVLDVEATGHCSISGRAFDVGLDGSMRDPREPGALLDGLTVSLPRSASLAGVLLGIDGRAEPGVQVRISSGHVERSLMTDGVGFFQIDGLCAGEATVTRVVESGGRLVSSTSWQLTLNGDGAPCDFESVPSGAAGSLAGRILVGAAHVSWDTALVHIRRMDVTGQSSEPELTAWAVRARTGSYEVAALPPGEYQIELVVGRDVLGSGRTAVRAGGVTSFDLELSAALSR